MQHRIRQSKSVCTAKQNDIRAVVRVSCHPMVLIINNLSSIYSLILANIMYIISTSLLDVSFDEISVTKTYMRFAVEEKVKKLDFVIVKGEGGTE